MRSAERSYRSARKQPTVRSALSAAIRRLRAAGVAFGHGTTNARDEAAWLVLHALRLPLEELKPHLGRALSVAQTRRIEALLDERIRARKPTAYLTHEAWLGEHRFYIDERALVPRSYIAELLRERLRPWVPHAARVRTALDLCTGSGCLAILLALAFPKARVDAADISPDALEVARRNVRDYRLSRRVRLVKSDLYSALMDRRYDLIVANPPYVRESVMRRLPAEYRREPRLALAGGPDGLDHVREIVARAPDHLATGGVLVVEVGHARERVERAFRWLPLVWPGTSGGDDCVFVITREALLAAPVRSRPATRGGALPRRREARSPDRA